MVSLLRQLHRIEPAVVVQQRFQYIGRPGFEPPVVSQYISPGRFQHQIELTQHREG